MTKPAKQWRLRLLAGSSRSDLAEITPNLERPSLHVESESFQGRLYVRVAQYDGFPRGAPSSCEYLEANPDQLYSIQLCGTFKKAVSSADLVFGNEFDAKLKMLPPGTDMAVKLVKWWLDPGLECELRCEKPWASSPAIVTMNKLSVGFDKRPSKEECLGVVEGGGKEWWGGKDRKKHFGASEEARNKFHFQPGMQLEMDFCNGMVDFCNFTIHVPRLGSVCVLPYWDGKQRLYYVLKNKSTLEYFMVLAFELVQIFE